MSSIKFNPYGNNILIKMDPDIIETNGVKIPLDSVKTSQTGEIVSIGDGSKDDPMDFIPGDKALFMQGSGQDVTEIIGNIEGNKIDTDKYRILNRNLVLGTF